MTKLPADDRNVTGIRALHYRVGPKCAVPDCTSNADHGHHLWRKSFTGGKGFDWVQLPDGRTLQNVTGLCVEHHRRVTANEAVILYDDERNTFSYLDKEGERLLRPQPQTLEAVKAAMEGRKERPPRRTHVAETCPVCGHRPRPSDELPPGEKRPKARWGFTVPKDERENGVEVIERLLLECAKKLGRHEHRAWRYYVLVEVLATFLLGNVEVPAS